MSVRHSLNGGMAKHTLIDDLKDLSCGVPEGYTLPSLTSAGEGRGIMCYVIQVRSGTEQEIVKQCLAVIPKAILGQCFLPCFEEVKRYLGSWHTKKRLLFPGYVFLVSPEPEELYRELKHVIGLTKLLKTGSQIVPLKEEEVEFLLELGGEEQFVELSKGILENEKVVVLEGPLKGREGLIRKIDRHKRLAWLEIEMFGRKTKFEVGLEIVRKE